MSKPAQPTDPYADALRRRLAQSPRPPEAFTVLDTTPDFMKENAAWPEDSPAQREIWRQQALARAQKRQVEHYVQQVKDGKI